MFKNVSWQLKAMLWPVVTTTQRISLWCQVCSLSYAFAVISGFTEISYLNKKYQSIIVTLKMYFRIWIAVLMNTVSFLHNKTIAIM